MMEIECRIQDVGSGGFERLLTSLQSHRGWTNNPAPVRTLDMMHATGVRETASREQAGPSTFLRKVKHAAETVSTPSGYNVRFALAAETESSADASEVHIYRHKQRFTFEHRGLFKFELTRVKQGPTDIVAQQAETQYEIEIEFCGQGRPESARPEYLADSMLMKVADLLHQLTDSTRGASTKRKRPADGALQECDEVDVAPGTEVILEPSGHGAPLRYNGEMPAELARWLYSHAEADGRVCVMSEPAQIGRDHFPLFYFCGHVDKAAVTPRRA